MAKTDAEWEAQSDADALINARLIRNDGKRYKRAIKFIKATNKATADELKKKR